MIKHALAMQGDLSKVFYEKYGRAATPIIAEIMGQSGAGSAEIVRKMMPVKSMKDVSEIFKMMRPLMELGMEIGEVTDEEVHIQVAKCPFGLEGTSKELCEAVMTHDAKTVSIFLGQEVETKILKSIAAGDEKCQVIFATK